MFRLLSYQLLVCLLGIRGALSNPNTVSAYPFLDIAWLQAIFTIMSAAGRDAQDLFLDICIHDRGVLFLEAIGAGEIAAEARHDGEREARRIVPAGLIALGEAFDLVGVIGNQHGACHEISQDARRTIRCPLGQETRKLR